MFTLNQVRESLTKEIKLQGEILARTIALNADDPLIANDDLYLAALVTDAVKNEGVEYAYIVDKKNIIRAHNTIELIGKARRGSASTTDLYEVTLPIVLAGKKEIGRVYVGLGMERIESTTNTMQLTLILISIVGLSAGILGALFVSKYLTDPIKELVIGVRAIADGDFDQKIEKESNDEIGDLTEAFNQMTRSLQEKEHIKDAFRRYVSRQVAEEIFKNPLEYIETLKGLRKKVTILFADIRGFTPLTERLSAEEVVSLLNDALTGITKIIFKYEGMIDKFIGDSVMAVFGAPIAHEDDVDRSISAAVEIQKSIREMNKKRKKENKEAINVGIGINTGDVVVGNIGAKVRLDYTVIGGSVNLANRLQEVASGGEIIVSKNIYKEAKVSFKFSEPMRIKVKGKDEPIEIYRVLY